MSLLSLEAALGAVDWNENVSDLLKDGAACEKIAEANRVISLWSHQIQMEESGNPALSFLREMQVSGQNVAALVSLALYKPAASSMRTVVESSLYYSYFRTHSAELSTLVRVKKYYISKSDIIDFHKEHTFNFSERQGALSAVARLEAWYRDISSIVHGQVPGAWSGSGTLSKTKYDKIVADEAASHFLTGAMLVNHLFISTLAPDIWHGVSKAAKKTFLRGLTGAQKAVIGLDAA